MLPTDLTADEYKAARAGEIAAWRAKRALEHKARERRTTVSVSLSPHFAGKVTISSARALQGLALGDVINERIRHIEQCGYTIEHDQGHDPADLILAAISYFNEASDGLDGKHHDPAEVPDTGPFPDGWSPKDPRANLVTAIAIGWAALDRIDNAPRDAGDDHAQDWIMHGPFGGRMGGDPEARHRNLWPRTA